MSIAIDTNVLVRLLVRDDEAQYQAASRLVEQADAAGEHASADFADCLHNARAAQLGRTRFVTFDAGAARLPRGELLGSSN